MYSDGFDLITAYSCTCWLHSHDSPFHFSQSPSWRARSCSSSWLLVFWSRSGRPVRCARSARLVHSVLSFRPCRCQFWASPQYGEARSSWGYSRTGLDPENSRETYQVICMMIEIKRSRQQTVYYLSSNYSMYIHVLRLFGIRHFLFIAHQLL